MDTEDNEKSSLKEASDEDEETQRYIEMQQIPVSDTDATRSATCTSIAEQLHATTSDAAIPTGDGLSVSVPSSTHNAETGLIMKLFCLREINYRKTYYPDTNHQNAKQVKGTNDITCFMQI